MQNASVADTAKDALMTVATRRKGLSSWIYLYALSGIIPGVTFFTYPGLRLYDYERNASMFVVIALVVLHRIECNRVYKRSNLFGKIMVAIPGAVAILCVPVALLLWSTVY